MTAPCTRCRKPACDYSRLRCTMPSCELRHEASIMNARADRAAYAPALVGDDRVLVHKSQFSPVARAPSAGNVDHLSPDLCEASNG